jgi:hypothetical protein
MNLESFGMMTRIEKRKKGNTWAKTYPSILKAFETRTPRKEKSSPPKLFPYNSQFLVEHKTLKIEHKKKILLQDIKICDFQNIEITQSRAVCKISGSVARASERASEAFPRARVKGTQEGTTGSTFWSREDDDNSADCSAWNCHHLRVLGSSSYHWNITPPVFLFFYFCVFFSLFFFSK